MCGGRLGKPGFCDAAIAQKNRIDIATDTDDTHPRTGTCQHAFGDNQVALGIAFGHSFEIFDDTTPAARPAAVRPDRALLREPEMLMSCHLARLSIIV